jgi:hypothetical protein
MTELDIPAYKWPILGIEDKDADLDTVTPAYNVIQARVQGQWVPCWIVVDADGLIIGKIELEEPLTPEDIAAAVTKLLRRLHNLPDRGGWIAPANVQYQAPPED